MSITAAAGTESGYSRSINQHKVNDCEKFYKGTKYSGALFSACAVAYGIFNRCGALEMFKDMANYSTKCPCTGACTEFGGPGTWLTAGAVSCLIFYGLGKIFEDSQNNVRVPRQMLEDSVVIPRAEHDALLAASKKN